MERKVFASSVLVIMRVIFGPTLLRLLLSVKATLSVNDDESSYFAEFFYGSHPSKHHKFLSSTDRHNLDQALYGVNAGLLEHFGKRNEHLELVGISLFEDICPESDDIDEELQDILPDYESM